MKIKRDKSRREDLIYCRYVKRILDILFSLILLFFLLLPMLAIAVAVKIDSPGKAIFKQTRLGLGGRPFVCYKFRTMDQNAPPSMPAAHFFDRDRYITRVGRFLRRSSLDELPQLFNVLKGDMSLVGPRPLICEEENVHKERMDRGVYSIRPGITGMAQINGRNLLCDEEKIKSDAYYLENIKMKLDAKILFQTVFKVLKGEGISKENEKI